jgi:predicted metal-dependent peptidase
MIMKVSSETEKALDKAKFRLITRHQSAFVCTLLFSLQSKWSEDIENIHTDGINLTINPDYFMGLEEPVRVSQLAKEAWHVAFNHMGRRNGRDQARWDKAASHVVNLELAKAGFMIPSEWLQDSKYKGLSTDEVYNLIEEAEGEDDTPNPQAGNFGDITGTPEEKAANQQKVENTIIKASTQAEMKGEAGSIPGAIHRMLDTLLHPTLPWTTILANYLVAFDKTDYSYKRPNRRYIEEAYLPSLYDEACGKICVFPDTSGSVSQEDFTAFLSEIQSIKTMMNPTELHVGCFDHQLHPIQILTQEQQMDEIEMVGGGGTNFDAPLQYVKEHTPELAIIFTDGYAPMPNVDITTPVLWIVYQYPDFESDIGTIIHFE